MGERGRIETITSATPQCAYFPFNIFHFFLLVITPWDAHNPPGDIKKIESIIVESKTVQGCWWAKWARSIRANCFLKWVVLWLKWTIIVICLPSPSLQSNVVIIGLENLIHISRWTSEGNFDLTKRIEAKCLPFCLCRHMSFHCCLLNVAESYRTSSVSHSQKPFFSSRLPIFSPVQIIIFN